MTKVNLILNAVLLISIMETSCGGKASNETSTSIEASLTDEVIIGNQVWMTKNLNVDQFRNEGLFNYLQKVKWLHPYTAIWTTTIKN